MIIYPWGERFLFSINRIFLEILPKFPKLSSDSKLYSAKKKIFYLFEDKYRKYVYKIGQRDDNMPRSNALLLECREKKNNNSGLFQRIKLTHISKDAELRWRGLQVSVLPWESITFATTVWHVTRRSEIRNGESTIF